MNSLHAASSESDTLSSLIRERSPLLDNSFDVLYRVLSEGEITKSVEDKVRFIQLLILRLGDRILSTRVHVEHSRNLSDAEYIRQWMHQKNPYLEGLTPFEHILRFGEYGFSKVLQIA